MAPAELEQTTDGGATNKAQHVADRVKLFEANIRPATPTSTRHNNKNNLNRVVPVGILIVLFTLYLSTAALQRNYSSYREQTAEAERRQHEAQLLKLHKRETERRTKILEKLLEYKDLCTELEVFTKDMRWVDEFEQSEEVQELEDALQASGSGSGVSENHEKQEDNGETIGTSGGEESSDSGSATVTKMRTTTKRGHKRRNGHRHNKSTKHETNNNKKLEPKKSSTAEPIIYLFALVFIYLLLKAASDINQHYKSQAKGDKRLRRCSLQSYAQQHKQDRRASKVVPDLPKKSKQLLMETRSKSVDPYNDPAVPDEYAVKKSEILANLRKYTSLEEKSRLDEIVEGRYTPPIPTLWDTAPLTHERRQSGELMGVSNIGHTDFSQLSPSRRCSVPVSLNYQRQKLGHAPHVPIVNIARRTSIAGAHVPGDSHLAHGDYGEGHLPEVKRRVRMINRH